MNGFPSIANTDAAINSLFEMAKSIHQGYELQVTQSVYNREQVIAGLTDMLIGLTVHVESMSIPTIQTFARKGSLFHRKESGRLLDGLGLEEYVPIGWCGTTIGTIIGVSPSSAHPYVAWRRWGARKIGEVNLYNSDVELSPGRQVKIIRVTSESR